VAKRLPASPPVLSGYTYSRPLGVGGFADVFLFEQNLPRRSVAVKVLLQDIVDADLLRMFNVEADVMARLSAHPSILTVYDASISSDGRPFLVMELCPASMGNRYRAETISVAEVLNTGVKIASALETAHRTGLLHRDIKPSNILVTTFGSPVLADFGIASSIAGSSKGDDVIAMSVPWSAPEVVEERTAGTVASEVWALGSTLYTLLAGRTPFEVDGTGKNSREQLSSRISKARYTPISRQDIPARLQAALAKSMSKDPAQRQSSMLEFATELQYVQYELGLMPTPLEVAADGWDSGGSAVDFDNSASRGPVQTTVATESKRASGAKRSAAQRAREDDEAVFSQAAVSPGKSVSVSTLVWIGVAVVVLAAAAIAASVIIGGM